MARQPVTVRLKTAQILRAERRATVLWPQERLDIGEISRWLWLEHLL